MINSFRGSYHFLSNFYTCVVEWKGLQFPSVEHAYQAAKCDRRSEMIWIQAARTAADAKVRGRKVQMRRDFEENKLAIMGDLLTQKFSHPDLAAALLATRPHELIEGNNWGDRYWGMCGNTGENNLGKLLMRIRDKL